MGVVSLAVPGLGICPRDAFIVAAVIARGERVGAAGSAGRSRARVAVLREGSGPQRRTHGRGRAGQGRRLCMLVPGPGRVTGVVGRRPSNR